MKQFDDYHPILKEIQLDKYGFPLSETGFFKKKKKRSGKTKKRNAAKRNFLWLKQNGKCKYCPKILDITEATLDHIIPRSKGGSNDIANLAVSCYDCNHDKGDKLIGNNNFLILKEIIKRKIQ